MRRPAPSSRRKASRGLAPTAKSPERGDGSHTRHDQPHGVMYAPTWSLCMPLCDRALGHRCRSGRGESPLMLLIQDLVEAPLAASRSGTHAQVTDLGPEALADLAGEQ